MIVMLLIDLFSYVIGNFFGFVDGFDSRATFCVRFCLNVIFCVFVFGFLLNDVFYKIYILCC